MEIQNLKRRKNVRKTKELIRGGRLIKQKINYPRPITEEGCGKVEIRSHAFYVLDLNAFDEDILI